MPESSQEIRIRLTGENLSPDKLDVVQLCEVLRPFRDFLAAIAASASPIEGPVVCLTGIAAGSVQLQLATTRSTKRAYQDGVRCVALDRVSQLPDGAQRAMVDLRRSLAHSNLMLHLPRARGREVVLSGDLPPELKRQSPTIKGRTTVYGKVLRVGGDHPRIDLQQHDNIKINVHATEELCQKVASRLYLLVGLRGMAEFDVETFEIRRFKAEELTPFKPSGGSKALADIRETFGDVFGTEDPDAFVQRLREG